MEQNYTLAAIIVILAFCTPFALIYWIVKKIKGNKNRTNTKSKLKEIKPYKKGKKNIKSLTLSNQTLDDSSHKSKERLRIVDDRISKKLTSEEMVNLGFDPFLKIKTFSSELKTKVTYSNHDGKIIFERIFTALEMGCERIDDYLLIQFARSDGDDAFKLYFIDLLNNKVIFSVYPDFYWNEVVSYDGNILIIKNQYGDFEINNSGELVDKVTYLKAVAVSYSSESIGAISTLFDILDKNEENISFYHTILDECFSKLQSEFHALSYLSDLLKLKGDIYEYQMDHYNAYRVYSLGLKLNPKLSVRNAIKKVSKQLRENTIDSINKSIIFLAESLIAQNKELKEKTLEKSRLDFEEGVRTGRIVIKESEN